MLNSVLKLIRYQNLLIIAVTQYLMRWCILKPFLQITGFELQLDEFHFFLLVLSTIFIAAAGYIINDYFDTRTDRVNKPSRVVIGKTINRRWAILMHAILNVAGIGIGIYLSLWISVPQLSIVFLLTSGFLWFYSTNYKKQFLIGNLIVALLTGVVPMLVVLFEIPLLNREYGEIMLNADSNFNYILIWIAGFAFFAFLTTLIREIIKDAEDFEGDNASGMSTLPIVIGGFFTKLVLSGLILFLIFCLIWVPLKYLVFSSDEFDYMSSVYFILLLVVPAIFLLIRVIYAKNKDDYSFASQLTKFIMMSGILYSIVVRYIALYQIN